MNEQCRSSHQKFLDCDLSKNAIVPVPIDARQRIWSCVGKRRITRIVSVGRIVPFKAYVFALPKIVAELNSRGIIVQCDIFGYGDDEEELARLIEKYDVMDSVKFHGSIELGSFDSVVSKYDLFVGMGTAALQAAQLGVPTILAVVDDPNGAHGFFDAAPFGNLGEGDSSIPRKDLAKLIQRYIGMSSEERNNVSHDCTSAATLYVADDYVEKLTGHSVVRTGLASYLAAAYCKFYIWMSHENSLRQLVRLAKDFSGLTG